MKYTLWIEPEAQSDIQEAYKYYFEKTSEKVAQMFFDDLQHAYHTLGINPFFQIRIKNYRALPLRHFPYLLFFIVDQDASTVKVLALFQTHQDSAKYPS